MERRCEEWREGGDGGLRRWEGGMRRTGALGPQLWEEIIQYHQKQSISAGATVWAHSIGCLHPIWDIGHPSSLSRFGDLITKWESKWCHKSIKNKMLKVHTGILEWD